jgi:formylglycine-generating enzyme required for sulfatase activity
MMASMRVLAMILCLFGWAGLCAEPALSTAGLRPGFIQVKCEPGVRILLDGKVTGLTSRDLGGHVIQDVPPGLYVIQAQKEGFRAQESRITVHPGAVQVVWFLPFDERAIAGVAGVAPAAIGQRTGVLVIRSVPVECRLHIPKLGIDAEKFAAECRCEAVPAGTYEIEAAALGQSLRQAVTVEEGKTADVFINFIRGEVQTLATLPPAVPGAASAPAAAPTAETVQRLAAELAECERELGGVRSVLQVAREGTGLDEVRRLLARRDDLARRQRELAFELSVMRQRQRQEEDGLRREATLQRRKEFDADYAEYGRLLLDADLLPEMKDRAWQALCQRWSIEPGKGAGRLLWDDTKAVPYQIVSRVVDLGDGVEMELVEVIAGSFAMGSEDGDADEKPVRTIFLTKALWMGRFEVTQAQYRAVTGDSPAHFRGENRPVENVTWREATAFCQRLTERERQAETLPSGYQYRLPTEAEWEYACRAGSATPYAFGDRLEPAVANYDVSQGAGRGAPSSARETLPVGSFRPNPWDLHDLHGNVWEWCADWYDRAYYARAPATNPCNVRPSSSVVCRGGSWANPMSFCRSANRNYSDPRRANHMTGFRVVLGPPPGE